MAQPTSSLKTCNNNNNNPEESQHTPLSNQDNLFPFPGFTITNKTNLEDYTPITKSILKHPNSEPSSEKTSSSNTTKTPPVEPSVSPEIQSSLYESILVSGAANSTCYGAGHVISGVIDRRKCKAKGILSAGHSKRGQDLFRKSSSPSLIPFPTEASISWHLSPSNVDKKDDVSSISPSVNTPQEERILSLDFNGECSPFSDILSSGNIMQTPNSNSSLEGFQLKQESLSPKDTSSPWDPPRLSSEFEDFSPLLENESESEMRVSWKDEVMINTFEKDDLDCCRLLSDEEIDADGLLESSKETLFPKKVNQSICTDDGGLTASADSDWTQHYKNQSFEL